MSDTYIDGNQELFQAFMASPEEGPFQMLNLLKFKDKVAETGTTGAEAYLEYMQAVQPFFLASKAKVVYMGKPLFTLIGPEDGLEWDKVLIVEYASKADFIGMVTKEDYPRELRKRALENSRLIVCITD